MPTNQWFDISRDGLRKLVAGRDRGFIIGELVQNAWDEAVSRAEIEIGRTADGFVSILVSDDAPHGFADLRHAYTVFAESNKKGDPEKRGRFNLGEKLVLALAREARVVSTSGTIIFNADGTRTVSSAKRVVGSVFTATLDIPAREADALLAYTRLLIPPANVTTLVGGRRLVRPQALATASASLPTLIADAVGVLRPTKRVTAVEAFAPIGDEAMLYEMGIPVCSLDLPWSLNVGQKVPLNSDRDGVTPAYLRAIYAFALNRLHDRLTEENAAEGWVGTALESPDIEPDAVRAAVAARFGERRVVFDPAHPESNTQAINAGYAVVHGGSFSRDAWRAIRDSEALPSAGTIFPTRPEGPPGALQITDLSPGMKQVASFTSLLGARLLSKSVRVEFWTTLGSVGGRAARATYSPGVVRFAVDILRRPFFDRWDSPRVLPGLVSLVLHEFAHDRSEHHLDESFFGAIQKFAGRVVALALSDPSFFTASFHQGLVDGE